MTADDARLSSIEFLLSNLPVWITQLETILDSTTPPRQETRIVQPRQSERTATTPEPEPVGSDLPIQASPSACQTTHEVNAHGGTQARPSKHRTRSTSSSTRSGATQRKKKKLSEVYYRGDAQRSFEMVVKEMAKSRNMLRKGKLQATVESLAQDSSGSDSQEQDHDDHGENVNHRVLKSKIQPRLSSQPMRSTLFGRKDRTYVFDQIDKHVEQGQILVEKAAFRLLRDGQCRSELICARDHLRSAALKSEKEMDRLKAKESRTMIREGPAANDTKAKETVSSPAPILHQSATIAEHHLEVDPDAELEASSDDEQLLPTIQPRYILSQKHRAPIGPLRLRSDICTT